MVAECFSFGNFMVLEDIRDRRSQVVLRDHAGCISAMAMSSSGSLLVSGEENTGKILTWSLNPLMRSRRLSGLSGTVLSVHVSPDDKMISACDEVF